MSPWLLYWILRCDDIRSTFGFAAAAFLITAIVSLGILLIVAFALMDSNLKDDENKRNWLMWRRCLYFITIPIFIVTGITNCAKALIPSTAQMAVIYVVPKVANCAIEDEVLRKIPKKLVNLADNWIDELSPNKPEKK